MARRRRTATYLPASTVCKNGHLSVRYSNGNCVECLLERERLKQADPEFAARKRATESARYRDDDSLWIKAAYKQRGQFRRLMSPAQCPAWASADAMTSIYQIATQLIEHTGLDLVVDHVVPLRGRTDGKHAVCGLHCEDNLQIILKPQNVAKGATLWPGK